MRIPRLQQLSKAARQTGCFQQFGQSACHIRHTFWHDQAKLRQQTTNLGWTVRSALSRSPRAHGAKTKLLVAPVIRQGGSVIKKLQQYGSAQLLAQDRFAMTIHTMDFENVLCQIYADSNHLRFGRSYIIERIATISSVAPKCRI